MTVIHRTPRFRTPEMHKAGPIPRLDADAERAYRLFESHLNDAQQRDMEHYGWVHILVNREKAVRPVHLLLAPAWGSLGHAGKRVVDERLFNPWHQTVAEREAAGRYSDAAEGFDAVWERAHQRWIANDVSDSWRVNHDTDGAHPRAPSKELIHARALTEPFLYLNGTREWRTPGTSCIQFGYGAPFRFASARHFGWGEAWCYDRALVMLLQSQDPNSWLRQYFHWE